MAEAVLQFITPVTQTSYLARTIVTIHNQLRDSKELKKPVAYSYSLLFCSVNNNSAVLGWWIGSIVYYTPVVWRYMCIRSLGEHNLNISGQSTRLRLHLWYQCRISEGPPIRGKGTYIVLRSPKGQRRINHNWCHFTIKSNAIPTFPAPTSVTRPLSARFLCAH